MHEILRQRIQSFHPRQRRKQRKRRGVILVFVLVFLALCCAVLVQSHSLVMRTTLRASQSEKELRNRWATVSLRRTILMSPDAFLEIPIQTPTQTDPGSTTIPRSATLRRNHWQNDFLLAGTAFRVRLEDENAKLPLQRLHQTKQYMLWRSTVRNLVPGNVSLTLNLPAGRLTQWRDILLRNTPSNHSSDSLDRLAATQYITIHTDGTVNIRSAEPSVLDALWKIHFGKQAPEILLGMREFQHPFDIASYCLAHGMNASESATAKEILTHQSQCFSLSILQTLPGDRVQCSRYIRCIQTGYADDQFRDPEW